jgi:hypothetical protein
MPKATPAARSTASPIPTAKSAATQTQSGRATRISVLLFATFLLVGVALLGAQSILQRALNAPNPSALTQRVCADFQAQNYSDLADQIDPASPAPDAGPFSTAALRTQLVSLDRIQGQVTRCDPGQVSPSDPAASRAQALLVIQRQRQNAPTTVLLVMRRGTDGAWRVSRETNLTPGL